jgi:FkbM family methyltransferase
VKRTSRLLRNRASLHRAAVASGTREGLHTPAARAPERAAAPVLIDPAAGPANSEPLTLARAKGHWLVGDWAVLADMPDDQIAAHPARDRVALLSACANLQLDRRERAESLLRQSLAWGCHPQLAARLLVSGIHNSLGRIAALQQDAGGIERHFGQALALTGDADAQPASQTRAVREMARLGLLPQAAGLLGQRGEALGSTAQQRPGAIEDEITTLRSELHLLQHELALAQQRAASAATATLSTQAGEAAPQAQALKAGSTSQLGQDLWVIERTGSKRGGYFVEFGATDGVRLSNTYLLEQALQWRGLCVEPHPRFFELLRRNRRCSVSNACIGPRSDEWVDFVFAEEYGGMARDMERDMHAATRRAYAASDANRASLRTTSLHDLLLAHGAPHDIDYLSIDTEGSEYAILSTFPFDRWRIRLITVEHNFSSDREAIRRLLEPLGYRRTEAQWDDWYEKAQASD